MRVRVSKSNRAGKKYSAAIEGGPTIHFGAKGFQDFTLTGDEERKAAYLARHKVREDWTLGGVKSAGFWARWLLWNKPSLAESIADLNRRFTSLSVRS